MTKAAIIGLGTMGPGIAATLARGGMSVTAYDASADQRARAAQNLALAQTVLGNLGVPNKSNGSEIRIAETLADCVKGADFVLETVPEKLDLKIEIFREVEKLVDKTCILASDTSGIPITKIQAGVAHPERLVGMHWSNPPHIIPMIEVVAGEKTSPEIVKWMVDVIKSIGLLPVVVKKDVPGFVENRVLYALMRECVDLVDQGVIDVEGLDTCVSWGIGYKLAVIGPMALLDMAGLDIYQAVGSYLNKELCNRTDVSKYVTDRTASGKLGIKTGSGIFDYTPERIAELREQRARKLVSVRKTLQS
ncbi:5-formyl-3-hydroxy-2-methylpyridine 4-carboxylate 5-dehydrogenase [Dongia soli]|uniref:L-gulonate 3-dehydrogenase n=1 Tax=Dongia soli TaxID=600628 RepID=A0ABU5EE68_9PROT|nr:5-formyl-3-hydroxy-2-methylpyridine 4-carboxylate 5-dehydrogenase [Dongia soli]MDY0884359.1 5-formyl-3-hydroxy-2-methylpyridine 4-carboxylate 5-dehydrogenase [Dongia soli]